VSPQESAVSIRHRLRIAREGLRLLAAAARERLETGYTFNPFSADARRDPYRIYRRLREGDPVHRSPAVRGWVLFRHRDCVELLRDGRFSADDRNLAFYGRQRAAAAREGLVDSASSDEPVMLRRDPPDHTRLRGLVNKAFTARAVEKLRPRVEALADELTSDLARRGSFDVIADFAVPLPVTIIAEMLGIPAADRELFKRWSDHMVGFLDPQASPGPRVLRRTVEEFFAYVDRIAEQRRRRPADDLLSALVLAEEEGDRLSARELRGTLALLLAAGNETTTNLIGNGLLALLRHPEQLARLREEPGLAPAAVEELLRWDSPVQLTMRIPLEEVELRGRTLRPGQAIVAVLGSANRDPQVFADPERLDLARGDNRHLSFGQGVHFCLGAQLARLEGQVALGALVRRFPDLRLATEDLRWRRLTFLRGLASLPVRA
jgi:cytochrome P450